MWHLILNNVVNKERCVVSASTLRAYKRTREIEEEFLYSVGRARAVGETRILF